MTDPWLDTMEERLDVLEKQVFGASDKDKCYPKDADKVIDTLSSLNTQVSSIVTGHKKMESMMQKLPQLSQLLDPTYIDKLTLSEEAKMEVILTEEELIRKQGENLEKVEKMLNLLNSEHIKAVTDPSDGVVPSLQGNLQKLGQAHVEQQDEANQLTEETKDVLLHYNDIITNLSKQFVHWDEVVTGIEAAKQTQSLQD